MLDYLPLIFQLLVALAIAVGGIATSMLLGKKGSHNRAKDTAYECGKDPIGPSQTRFSVKFYVIAMIFILFDIEVIFMYPWALCYTDLIGTMGANILFAMLFFVLVVEVGHFYAYKKGVFDWNKKI